MKEIIDRIAGTRSRNEKLGLLRDNDENVALREVLAYTYDPFKHYFINRIPGTWVGKGDATLGDLLVEWTSSLERLTSRAISGQAAKELVQEIITCLTPEDAEIFKRVIKKDIRAGISATTINKAIPGLVPVFGVNLASKYKGWTGPKWMSLKIDGLRSRYEEKDGEMNFFTRNGHKILGLDHLKDQIDPMIKKLDVELQMPDIDFDSGSGKIRSHGSAKECIAHVIDVPVFNMTKTERYGLSQELIDTCGPQVKLLKNVFVKTQEKIDMTMAKALSANYEGLVLVEPDSFYEEKRTKAWQKLKGSGTVDVPIVGFEPGKEGKQFEHTLGAMVVELAGGVRVSVGQGHEGSLSNAKRDEIWANQDKWLGRTVEVLFHQPTAKGSLRHPRYVRTRDDK